MNRANRSPWTDLRIATGVAAFILTALLLLVLYAQIHNGFDFLGFLVGTPLATAAVLCWWCTIRGQYADSRTRMMYSAVGGFILGGIGFVAGFIGPMIFMPHSNQGPLIGIFGTGPLGFAAGLVLGAIVGLIRTRQRTPPEVLPPH